MFFNHFQLRNAAFSEWELNLILILEEWIILLLLQKRPLASDFTSPVTSKKQRIGHQHSYIQPAAGGHSSSSVLHFTSLSTFNPSPSVGSMFPCTHEVQQKDKFQSSCIPAPASVQREILYSNGKKNELGRLKQWHSLDFDEGIHVLLFLTLLWITVV